MEACGASSDEGYTQSYTPGVAASLAEPYDTELLVGTDSNYINTTSPVECSLYMGESIIRVLSVHQFWMSGIWRDRTTQLIEAREEVDTSSFVIGYRV